MTDTLLLFPKCITAKPVRRRCRARLSLLVFVMLSGALSSASPAIADANVDAGGSGLTLSGFGTLGVARTSNDQAEFVRDLSQPGGIGTRWSPKIDTVVGVQANYQVHEGVEAVAQAVSRYRADGSFRPELTWAFLKYDPNPNVSLRAGRLGTEFYMLADSRLVGYSYLPIRPPGDYYGGLTFSYIDGGDVTATVPFAAGLLRGKLFTGLTREEAPIVSENLDLNRSRMSGGHIDYQQGAWLWRLGYSQLRFHNELPTPLLDLRNLLTNSGAPGAAAELGLAGKTGRFYSAGMSYDSGPLQVQLMLSKTTHESAAYEDSRAGYAIAGYRVGELTPYLGYSWTRSSPVKLSSGLGTPMDGVIANVTGGTHSDQSTRFFGVRWDFRHNMALKAQVDAIRGTPQSVYLLRWEKPEYDGRMNVFSLALDFVF